MSEFTEPTAEGGEPKRAPLKERVKRDSLMLATLVVSFIPVMAITGLIVAFSPEGTIRLVITGLGIATTFVVDYFLFKWAVDYFGIVPPVEFRREAWKEAQEVND